MRRTFDARRSSPGERHLHGRRAELARHIGKGRRLQRREAAEREEGHVSDAQVREFVDQTSSARWTRLCVLHANTFAMRRACVT